MSESQVLANLTSNTICSECSVLTLDDIPGSILSKEPEKCKKSELEWWMKCRGFSFKKSDTKAQLCNRVRHLSACTTFTVTDPDPGHCHLLQKQIKCSHCKTNKQNAEKNKIHKEDEKTKSSLTCTKQAQAWSRSTVILPETFSHIMISEHAKSSGKNTQYVEKPIEKGYKFFWDGYIHDVTCMKENNSVHIKCKCYRSQRKNEQPHSLSVKLNSNSGSVESGKCSCVAGITGFCNHIFALLYTIDHAKKMKLTEFPLNKTCTQKPAEWSKCRTGGISSEPIMECRVVKPKYGSQSTGIKPTLYQSTRTDIEYPNGSDLATGLKTLGGNLAFFSVFNCNDTDGVKTRLGTTVPVGSVLSYQLSLTEPNFHVAENIDCTGIPESKEKPPEDPIPFPWEETCELEVPMDVQDEFKLKLNNTEATEIEKSTRTQSLSDRWFNKRRNRLTASKFGLVMKRKTKNNQSFIKNTVISKKDLSNVPSVKYGTENEEKAKYKYKQYMERARNPVQIYSSGLFVNPKICWAGASPDGKVFDAKYGLGLLEVKCAYKHRDISAVDACCDPTFYCELNGQGLPCLKRNHHYYSQVQGQLGICGARWCDFVVYTNKGLIIERIAFDIHYWTSMINKLHEFYVSQIVPVLHQTRSLQSCHSDSS